MINNIFMIMLQTQANDHLAGINHHYTMYLEDGDILKVSWATVVEKNSKFVKYTVPQSFESSTEYERLARIEMNRTPYYNLDVFLN